MNIQSQLLRQALTSHNKGLVQKGQVSPKKCTPLIVLAISPLIVQVLLFWELIYHHRPVSVENNTERETHSSKMMWNSLELSKTSCILIILACPFASLACLMMSISTRMSSRQDFPLLLFLSTLSANCSPEDFSVHFLTIANLPLRGGRRKDDESGSYWWQFTTNSLLGEYLWAYCIVTMMKAISCLSCS